jgi:hypothetical protein
MVSFARGNNENLTLTEIELNNCHPVRTGGGNSLRALCPYHGSDHQRSLRVNLITGRFECFACGAWGYTEDAREKWRADHKNVKASVGRSAGRSVGLADLGVSPSTRQARPQTPKLAKNFPSSNQPAVCPVPTPIFRQSQPEPVRDDLPELLQSYQTALPGSQGEAYLHQRKISLELAQQYGVGYAPPGKWAHYARDWKYGRLIVPHTDPAGRTINLYGRAVGSKEDVPKEMRHDHLPGVKGYFNAMALTNVAFKANEPLYICEGVFDALSLIAAGLTRTIAVFGLNGWRWDWARNVSCLVFALDNDETGQRAWRELAREARLKGKKVGFLPIEAYGGCKDVNEAWEAGKLSLEPLPPELLNISPIREPEVSSPAINSTEGATYSVGRTADWAVERLSDRTVGCDPRPDLVTDSHHWKQLLECASRLADLEIFGGLHGLRCCGVQIAQRGSGLILIPGELSPEEYVMAWNDCLSRRGKVVDGLLAQIKL